MNESNDGELDRCAALPARNRWSLVVLMVLTGLNAFNDNLLKMVLVGLAPKVVEGTLGQDIGLWLGAIILVPYILFAPVAGYLSDRFSKRSVILAMLLAQCGILAGTGAIFAAEAGQNSVLAALGMFFLLAVQSTLFSPAKMGILKELAGSRRLGVVSSGLQMMTMLGILGGLAVGGPWFDSLFAAGATPWQAAAQPVWVVLGLSLLAVGLGWMIQPTQAQAGRPFAVKLMWEHFGNLRETLGPPDLRRACWGVAVYWFVASMAAAIFIDVGLQWHPDLGADGAASAASKMTLMVGLGTVLGSVLVGLLCRRKVQLALVPLGALGMALALLAAGYGLAPTTGYDASLIVLGMAAALYLIPTQAFIQDRAEAARRGRVLASMNLLDSLAGILAVALLFGLKKGLGLGPTGQFWLLALLMLAVLVQAVRLLPREIILFFGLGLFRWMYRVRTVNGARLPEQGGVLLLPNHVSYMDAFLLSVALDRPIRFVIWDTIYKVPMFTGILQLFGAVPIAPARAKDAVRGVAAALKEGQVVCLFPEGQITRHGMVNEMRRGFELMARQAGVPLVPVFVDGLWGSIFSFKGGRFFTKRPQGWRRRVTVWVGTPLPAAEVNGAVLQRELLKLGSVAFAARAALQPMEGEPMTVLNTRRLREVDWLKPDERVQVCGALAKPVLEAMQGLAVKGECRLRLYGEEDLAEAQVVAEAEEQVVLLGTVTSLSDPAVLERWRGKVKRVIAVLSDEAMEVLDQCVVEWGQEMVFPALVDASSGEWLALAVPDPSMPEGEEEDQRGNRPGTLGRLLPGIDPDLLVAKGWTLRADGFVLGLVSAAESA
jgi:acyl-[acyl-carrier-protein]-phospholipid O-acyltransferase / long-chain-fatty-acid--[acyl-carrier-protein] ligase